MKNITIFFALILVIAFSCLFALRFLSNEDDWICVQGEWVKHGNPRAEKPDKPCGNIYLTSPKNGEKVDNPFSVTGEARVFENQFNYRLKDKDGTTLAEGPAYANSPNIGKYGPFEIKIIYTNPKSSQGTLELFDYSAKDGSEIDKISVSVKF